MPSRSVAFQKDGKQKGGTLRDSGREILKDLDVKTREVSPPEPKSASQSLPSGNHGLVNTPPK